ncbi:MAG: M28 family peptidase [Bacteroidota bacterium]
MRKIITFILFSVAFSANAQLASTSPNFEKELLQTQIDVVYLASDYLQGRETGTIGEERAADYIVHRFKEIGLTPKGDNGTWFQEFPWHEVTNPHASDKGKIEKIGKNVIGYIDNGAKTTVVIGGHYDHLGMGESGSRHTGEPAIHNGADDNASGIAAIFRIADRLKKSNLTSNNYLFIAFSGEEKGLFGSKYYANNSTIPIEEINYMFNMDMIGMLNEDKVLAVQGTGTSPVWKSILEKENAQGLVVKQSKSGVGPSDHTSFYLKNIPVLHFFTGQHDYYHKPTDDAHILNYEGIIAVSDFMLALIKEVDGSKLEFTKTKDNQQRKAASFKVTLGVMPDYVFNGRGMRVDSVIEGRVGHKGGLKDGDIIIRIGNTNVTDIYAYMEGLSKYQRGDKTEVVVIRKDKDKKKEVKLKVKFD